MVISIKQYICNQKGLTLIELLAIIVILGIIAAIAVPAVGNIIDNSRKDAHIANALSLISAAKLYQASEQNPQNPMFYVATGGVLNDYVESLTDPWKNEKYTGQPKVEIGVDGVYRVSVHNDNVVDCKLENVPEHILYKGRKEACNFKGS